MLAHAIAAAALLVGCTSSEPARQTDDASGTCELVAEKCVTNAGVCCAQSGLLFDEARGCVSTTRKTIGCAPRPIPADSACIDLGIIGCAITHDGGVRRVWKTTSQAVGWSPAEGCSTELREKVLMASGCADAGA